jgi:hypothetical protein
MRRLPTLLLALALVAVAAVPAAANKQREDPNLNYILVVPDTWSIQDPPADWAKQGVVVVARRVLDKTRRGAPPDGEGAQATLSIIDAPQGKTLDDLAKDPQIRQSLLGRFGQDSTKWPALDVANDTIGPDDSTKGAPVETRILTTVAPEPGKEALSNNLNGKPSRTRGVMLLTIVRGKLFRLVMYAWLTPSPDDDENAMLKDDLDQIEMEFSVFTTKEEKKETPKPNGEGGAEPPVEEKYEGDAGERKEMGNPVQHWKLVKPKGIKSVEVDHAAIPTRAAYFEGSEASGSYQITFDVYKNGATNAQGVRTADQDLKKWIAPDWWENFTINHPDGEILTYEWPRRPRVRTIVTLPEMPPAKEAIVVIKKDGKRPIEVDFSDMEKMKVVDSPKRRNIGPKGDPMEAYRGAMLGNRPRVGPELILRFGWKTVTHTYMLTVSVTKDLLGENSPRLAQIRELLESIELTEK